MGRLDPGPIYRTWCPGAGESPTKGYRELGALDASTAARIHAERMTDEAWRLAVKSPDDVCTKCGNRRGNHDMRHPFAADPAARSVTIMVSEGQDISGRWMSLAFVVRRRMQPVFEVVV